MRHFLTLLLMGVTFSSFGQTEATDNRGTNSFYVPWNPTKPQLYKDKGAFEMKSGAGLSLSEFFSLEGNRYYFDYYQNLRYGPEERPGFTHEGSQTLNFLGVGQLPLSKAFTFFGKIGPSYFEPTDTEFDPLLFSYGSSEEWGISYATGARVYLNPRLQLSLEYMRTENDMMNIDSSVAQMTWNF